MRGDAATPNAFESYRLDVREYSERPSHGTERLDGFKWDGVVQWTGAVIEHLQVESQSLE